MSDGVLPYLTSWLARKRVAPASPDIEEAVKDCPQSISVTDFPSTNIWKQTSSTNPPNASFPAVFSVPLIISFGVVSFVTAPPTPPMAALTPPTPIS